MTTASFDFVSPPIPMRQRIAAAARMAGNALTAVMVRIRKHHEHRKAMRALMALDDHVLKDIGLHRSGISSAVRMGLDGLPITATGVAASVTASARPEQPAPAAGWR